jgi:6-phosphogluconolactonase
MSNRTIHRFADAEQVSQAAADLFVRCASDAMGARGRFVVALAGGSTPRRTYELLAQASRREQVDWQRVEFFWGDERSVPPDHKDSNYRMAHEALLRHVAVPPPHIHRMEAERADRDAAAAEYQADLARVFGVPADGTLPQLDLVLLGMGADGHTASLFPHTTGLRETRQWVVRNYVPKFATDRLTMTVPLLNSAACVAFVVAGPDKAPVLAEVLDGPLDGDRLPSQLVRPAGELCWLVDEAAAARLRGS